MTKALDVLQTTQKLLKTKASWVQGSLSRDRNGNECHPYLHSPVCYCLYGAVLAASNKFKPSDIAFVLGIEAIRKTLGFENIVAWNDVPERTHEEVLALLIRAIALEG